MTNTSSEKIYLGIDVGKAEHWACALSAEREKLFDGKLPNSEKKLVELYTKLSQKGELLVVVDQPATIGALAVATAQHMGIAVAYLPGLTMRRMADLYPGEAKTDKIDAFVIADAARGMGHLLRSLQVDDELGAQISMLSGFDLDLADQITATSNRIRNLLTQIHPTFEQFIGPRLGHKPILELLADCPTPQDVQAMGQKRIDTLLKRHGASRHASWAAQIMAALEEQTVVVVGTEAAGVVLPHLARQLMELHSQRLDVAEKLEEMLHDHPLYYVLTSMPGVGIRTAAVFIAETTGKHFASGAHLASYAGLAPKTRQSGTSIRSETAGRIGNRRLKRALFLSAFAALKDPTSKTYYDKKRAQGKHHNQAVLALAHRRVLTMFAMIRDGALYDDPKQQTLAA